MRTLTVAELKRKHSGAPTNKVPTEGTDLRKVYDLFQANKGVPISDSVYGVIGRHSTRAIADLTDYYGLDLRNLGSDRHPRWTLVGEWFGRVYVDYVAERLKEREGKGE